MVDQTLVNLDEKLCIGFVGSLKNLPHFLLSEEDIKHSGWDHSAAEKIAVQRNCSPSEAYRILLEEYKIYRFRDDDFDGRAYEGIFFMPAKLERVEDLNNTAIFDLKHRRFEHDAFGH